MDSQKNLFYGFAGFEKSIVNTICFEKEINRMRLMSEECKIIMNVYYAKIISSQ